ncbi:MAG: hypothetical protein U1G07_19980 [Verrucomicrobiota bacterium]
MKNLPLMIAAGLLTLSGPRSEAQSLYGTTFFGNELISIDPTTGAGTLIGSLGATVSPFGVANRLGLLYTFNPNSSQIQSISAANGQAGASFAIGVPAVKGEGDLAFRNDGVGFLAASLDENLNPANSLYQFDITAGTSIRIGSTGVPLDGLAFVGGTLYAIGQGEGKLFRVDTSTAALTEIGSLGLDQNSPVAGLAAAPDGSLLGAIDDRLVRIDTTTGLATPVDATTLDIGFSSVSGLAFAPIPEPPPVALITLSAFSLLLWKRQNRKH